MGDETKKRSRGGKTLVQIWLDADQLANLDALRSVCSEGTRTGALRKIIADAAHALRESQP